MKQPLPSRRECIAGLRRLSVLCALTLLWAVPNPCAAQQLEGLHTRPVSERMETIYAIRGQHANEEDKAQLLSWIKSPLDYSNLNPTQSNLFFNELLVSVRSIPNIAKTRLVRLLTACIEDEKRSLVHRDYAIQHLGHIYIESTQHSDVLEVLYSAVAYEDNQLASTAVTTLDRMLMAKQPVDTQRLKVMVLTGLESSRPRLFVHLAVRLRAVEVLPYAREAVFGEETNPNEQLIGLFALGEMGTADDYEKLKHFDGISSRCKLTKQAAEKKLKNRI